jgi:hypothetical protein
MHTLPHTTVRVLHTLDYLDGLPERIQCVQISLADVRVILFFFFGETRGRISFLSQEMMIGRCIDGLPGPNYRQRSYTGQ